jgi:hypothetical protein
MLVIGADSRVTHLRRRPRADNVAWEEDINAHVSRGNRDNAEHRSNVFSFSSSFKFCVYYQFQEHEDRHRLNELVVEIDLDLLAANGDNVVMWDLTTPDRAARKLSHVRARNYAVSAQEVVLIGHIPVKAITAAYELSCSNSKRYKHQHKLRLAARTVRHMSVKSFTKFIPHFDRVILDIVALQRESSIGDNVHAVCLSTGNTYLEDALVRAGFELRAAVGEGSAGPPNGRGSPTVKKNEPAARVRAVLGCTHSIDVGTMLA